MRVTILLLALAVACGRKAPRVDSSRASRPRPPIGFVGQWVQVAPDSRRGDTLTLRADSSAAGVILWADGKHFAKISRWFVQFTSRDPVASRQDWRQGHRDSSGYTVGGDPSCMFDERYRDQSAPGCVSLPVLCLGVRGDYLCEAFAVTADSLLLSRGARYVRARSTPAASRTVRKGADSLR